LYVLNKLQLADSGSQFSCVIQNAYGTVTSSTATLTVFNQSGPLFSFHGPDGGSPAGGLIQGTDGYFHGTTTYGGADGAGTLFLMTTNGLLDTVVSFNLTNGAQPAAALLLGADGNFYGTTKAGGACQFGTVFRLTPGGVLTSLTSFNGTNGAYPLAPLVQGTDGSFYGTTSAGGTNDGGTIFCLTPNGVFSSLFSFNETNGAKPCAALLQAADGNFYGTTEDGGTSGYGTIFSIATNGVLTSLFSFSETNGAYPQAALTSDPGGSFYGVTTAGGVQGLGTIFRFSANGILTSLYSFAETTGSSPSDALLRGSDGKFYGTTTEGGTYGDGTVFCLLTNGAVTNLLSLEGPNGSFPNSSLIQDNNSNLYCTASSGGAGYDGLSSSGNGTVFRLANPFPPQPPVITTQPASQTVPSGSAVTFSITAAGSPPLSYFWQRNSTNVPGATLPALTLTNVQYPDSGSMFACTVSSPYGYTNSLIAILSVLPSSLVQNGGFELGSFADWTTGGNFASCFVTSDGPYVHSGFYGAELGPVGAPGYLSQTLTTIPGDIYQISCWVRSDGKTPNEFSISWNGATLLDQLNISDTAWTDLQIQGASTNTITVLALGFEDDPGFLALDDISVYDLGTGGGPGQGTGTGPSQLQAVTLADGMITFSWSAQFGQTFQVQVSTSLDQPNWTQVTSLSATSTNITVSEPINNATQQFYRVVQP
jgi:uncharacterized repeat protein (TIGR03803 family)